MNIIGKSVGDIGKYRDTSLQTTIYNLRGNVVGAGLAPALDETGAYSDRATARVAPCAKRIVYLK